MNATVFLIGILLFGWHNLASAQQDGVLPYELNQVHTHCRSGALFFHVEVDIELAEGGRVKTNAINCLSNKDGLLVTLMCNPSTKTCAVSRERGPTAPKIEEGLRQLERAQTQSNRV